ncbi:MAG TPA: FAD-dependent oxidoreductase [Acidimicrobiales bacterium]|nr:FAD-dependent oxidoreductase [Acidimicrobiales bacterium]
MSFDVAVIGGGIAGASVAYELAARASVVLLEGEATTAFHTTGRSAAVFTENYGSAAIRALTIASRPFLTNPPSVFGDQPLLSPRGALWIGRDDQLGRLDALHAAGAALVPTLERVGIDGVLALCPVLDRGYVAGGVWEPDALDLDVHAIVTGYLRGFRSRGGTVQVSSRVVAAERATGSWRLRMAVGEDVEATVVVDAAGAWADEVARVFGARPLGFTPRRRTAFTFDAPNGVDAREWPLVVDADEGFYFKPEGVRLLGSPADEHPSPPCDARPEELDVAVALERIGAALAVELRHATRPWAGLRTFAPDRNPVVGADPTVEGLFWLAGQGGYGIQTAPAMATLAAQLVLDGGDPDAALAPSRF